MKGVRGISGGAEAAAIRRAACPLPGARHYNRILSWLGDASIVLLGESTHGTHDFYAARAALTRRLIEERGFSAVAIEGDWPDAYRVNRYVHGPNGATNAAAVLSGFARFPTWMWRNTAVAEFVSWLQAHNAGQPDPQKRAGFFGLDLYSMRASSRAVVEYLEERDPKAALAARRAYSCLDHAHEEPNVYAWGREALGDGNCAEAVTKQLLDLQRRRTEFLRRDGLKAKDEFFYAEQNARLAKNAEQFYRAMSGSRAESWNVRDQHMADTLDALLAHLRAEGQPPKIVVWAHNSHVGDARATEMGRRGELSLGQLARERHGDAVRSIGFTTYSGTVIAASEWGGEAGLKYVLPALSGSHEELLHEAGVPAFFLPLTGDGPARRALAEPRLTRAIGVIYQPETECWSHYFESSLAEQYDAILHFDETRAVDPLDWTSPWEEAEVPETFPTGV